MIQIRVFIGQRIMCNLLLDAKLNIRPRGRENSKVRKKSFAVVIKPSSRYRVTDQNINEYRFLYIF